MILEQIEVNSRDEYREAQEPRAFTWRGEDYEITEILDRWYEGYVDPQRMPLRYFRVEIKGGERFIIRYHELFRAWGIVLRDDMMEE
jgi:hypothetical protein